MLQKVNHLTPIRPYENFGIDLGQDIYSITKSKQRFAGTTIFLCTITGVSS
jgi:hypothetical protein